MKHANPYDELIKMKLQPRGDHIGYSNIPPGFSAIIILDQ